MTKRIILFSILIALFIAAGLMNNDDAVGQGTNVDFYIPYLYSGTSTTIQTNCIVSNTTSNTTDNVTFTVLAMRGNSSTISTALQNISITKLQTYETMNYLFEGFEVKENGTENGTDLLSTIGDAKWYSGKLSFGSSSSNWKGDCKDMPIVCFQNNAGTTTRRALSILCNDDATTTTYSNYLAY